MAALCLLLCVAMTVSNKRKIVADYSDGVDRKQLRQIRDRFLLVNKRRLERTYDSLSSRQADILRILPLLYQVNHPLLPGYVSRDAPRGISGYSPDAEALSIAAGFSRTFRFKQDRRHKPQIQSLFIMGSSGTLAHSDASDVDAWLCVQQDLGADAREIVTQKALAIDKWANNEGLELHTFVMCAEEFQYDAAIPNMDKESSGSAQHLLLLDEFYRTAILLSGCYPLWWLIPPGSEQNYQQITQQLIGMRFIKSSEVLDFGGLHYIPKSELVGAGLWQLYKSLSSPYKSTLKLMLAEVYARELPEYPSLSVEFKEAVYDDELEVEQLDPYFLLYRRLENYLKRQHQEKRLELVRKSFYLKVNKKLSRTVKSRSASWQRQFMRKQVEAWGWNTAQMRHLDERFNWKVNEVVDERQALLSELTNAYRFLTNYARANNIGSSITLHDMGLLGRKLYAVFQRKAGKVEVVNLGISPSMWEENLAIHHSSSQEFQSAVNAWLLYKNLSSVSDTAFTQPLRKTGSLIELLAWLYFNGIVSRATRLRLVPGESSASIRDLHSALDTLEQSFPLPLDVPDQAVFEHAAIVKHILLLVNFASDTPQQNMDAAQRISDRNDSLSYSSQRVNLVETIDQVVLNSWGEVSAVRYEVGETLLQNLQAYLQLCVEQADAHFELEVRCFSSFRSRAIEDRVRSLFYETRKALFENNEALSNVRYVLEMGAGFYLIQSVDKQFRFEHIESRPALMDRLKRAEVSMSPIRFDSYALEDATALKTALTLNEPDIVQVFYLYQANGIHICVLDEFGSVLEADIPRQDEAVLQSAIFNFTSAVLERRQLNMTSHRMSGASSIVLYVMTDNGGDYHVRRIKRFDLLDAEHVHAYVAFDGDAMHYDYSVAGRDFSYVEYGEEQMPALVHFFESQRKRSGTQLKLSDLSFPADPLGVLRNEANGFGVLEYLQAFVDFENALPSHDIT